MYLGMDLGTSGLRAVLMEADGRVVADADASYGLSHPEPGWSEQDPADWISACEQVVDALRESHGAALSAVRGIGLSGQMHGAVCLDAADRVLRPAILWNDTRSAREAASLDAQRGVRETSGNIVFPGFTAPKLLWLEEHEREIFAATARVLLPKDYLRLWLTGEAVSEMSDAAGTSWLDTGARDWSEALLAASHMEPRQMPRLVEGSDASGMLRAELAERWGMSGPVVVAGGGGDNAAAACGTGCVHEGEWFVSLGTSGVLLAARDAYAPAPETAVHTFCHALPGTWYQMGVILAATDSLNWLARNMGKPPAGLAAALPETIDGPGGALFLPYLSGERTPHNDADIRGVFAGLDVGHGPEALAQAVMEGVAYALADSHAALLATGARPERVLAIGGGTRSRFWLETLASVLNLPLAVPAKGEFGAALGAARLAQAADSPGTDPRSLMTAPEIAETIEPRADLVPRYAGALARYRALYPAIKEALT